MKKEVTLEEMQTIIKQAREEYFKNNPLPVSEDGAQIEIKNAELGLLCAALAMDFLLSCSDEEKTEEWVQALQDYAGSSALTLYVFRHILQIIAPIVHRAALTEEDENGRPYMEILAEKCLIVYGSEADTDDE